MPDKQVLKESPWYAWSEEDVKALEEKEHKEQEAHFHHTLLDFAELVRQHGIEKVMDNLDVECYWILHKWYTKGDL